MIQVFEEAQLLGSGISQDQNIHDSIIGEELQKVGVTLKDATLSKASENQHLPHHSPYFEIFASITGLYSVA